MAMKIPKIVPITKNLEPLCIFYETIFELKLWI